MKRYLCTAVFVVMGLTLTAPHAAHAKKQPDPKQVVDHKQLAEDARFAGSNPMHRNVLLELDAMDRRLVDTWVELRQAKAEQRTIDTVWGVAARKAADRRKAALDALVPRLEIAFERRYEQRLQKTERGLARKQQTVDTLASRSASGERLITARAATMHDTKMLSALRDMEDSVSVSKRATTGDRLSQLGLSARDGDLRETMAKHKVILRVVYDIKDLKADIDVLETRKKDGKHWSSRDDGTLKMTRIKLERTGKNAEAQIARVRIRIKKDIDKLESGIARIGKRVDKAKSGSKSQERYTDEKWALESELRAIEATDALFVRLAVWE
jgi:hypothetical protein